MATRFSSSLLKLAVLSALTASCAVDAPREELGHVQQGLLAACADTEMNAWRSYEDSETGQHEEANDAVRTFGRRVRFRVPTEARITSGNAGIGEVVLTVNLESEAVERCHYRGAAGQDHPTDPEPIMKGQQYLFDYCDHGHAAGDLLSADELVLHVESGDREAGGTGVSLEVKESPDDCQPVGFLPMPDMDPTRPTTFADTVRHIFQGPNAVQFGVLPETIADDEASLVSGQIVSETGAPVGQAWISVADHPEYGYTFSRADGAFDLVVRGGTPMSLKIVGASNVLIVRYLQPGIGRVDWKRIKLVPSFDPVLPVGGDSPEGSFIWGGKKKDASDARQGAIYFPSQLTAEVLEVAPDPADPSKKVEVKTPLTSFNAVLMERTVGGSPDGMPAELGPNVGYTYAADFVVAGHEGATTVQFSTPSGKKPVFYLHSFLGSKGTRLLNHTPIPMGYYDYASSRWVPTPSGRVITLLGVDGGYALVDADNDGKADAAGSGDVDAEERKILGKMITGTSSSPIIFDLSSGPIQIWRIPVEHFTPYDANLGIVLPKSATAPPTRPPLDPFEPCPDCVTGSIIEAQNATLGERIPVPGTPITLTYRSDKMPGDRRDSRKEIVVGPKSVSDTEGLLRIDVEVQILKQRTKTSYAAKEPKELVDKTHVIDWDGTVEGKKVYGRQTAKVTVGYAYRPVYAAPGSFGSIGAASSGGSGGAAALRPVLTTTPARSEIVVTTTFNVPLQGASTWNGIGLGGWGIDSYHSWNVSALELGTGARITPSIANSTVSRVGTGDDSWIGLGAAGDGTLFAGKSGKTLFVSPPAVPGESRVLTDVSATYNVAALPAAPNNLAVSPDGDVYVCVAAGGNQQIYQLRSGKSPLRVAGRLAAPTGTPDPSDALAASIVCSDGMFAGHGVIYLTAGSEYSRAVVLKLDVGTRRPAADPDAEESWLSRPKLQLFAGCDYLGYSCPKIVTDPGDCIDGTWKTDPKQACILATDADTFATDIPIANGPFDGHGPQVDSVAEGPDGSVYIAAVGSTSGRRIHRISPAGRRSLVAGVATSGMPVTTPDAKLSSLPRSLRLTVDRDGVLYLTGSVDDLGDGRCGGYGKGVIAMVRPDGSLTVLTEHRGARPFPDGVSVDALHTGLIRAVVATSDKGGDHLLALAQDFLGPEYCNANAQIVDIKPAIPFSATRLAHRGEVFEKDSSGHHVRTSDLLTGLPKLTFGHDTAGQLTTITDALGNTTTLHRPCSPPTRCNVDYIMGPLASAMEEGKPHVTKLGYDGDGFLRSVKRSSAEEYQFAYWPAGLLKTFRDPSSNLHQFEFTATGELKLDSQPTSAGGWTHLARSIGASGWTSTLTTPFAASPSDPASTPPKGRKKTFEVQVSDTERKKIATMPDSSQTFVTQLASGVIITKTPDGTETKVTPSPDPVYGMQSPVYSKEVRTKDGLFGSVALEKKAAGAVTTFTAKVTEGTTSKGTATTTVEKLSDGSFMVTSISAENRRVVQRLDDKGRPKLASAPGWGLADVSFEYADGYGRLTKVTRGTGTEARTTTYTWRASDGFLGALTANTSPTSTQTTFDLFDTVGRPLSATLPGGNVLKTHYDLNGNVDGITPPGRPLHGFLATAIDQLSTYTPPSASTAAGEPYATKYTYAPDGRATSKVLSRASTAVPQWHFTFDAADDAKGRPTTLVDDRAPNMSVKFGYDDAGESKKLKTLSWPASSSTPATVTLDRDGPLLKKTTWSGNTWGSGLSAESVERTYDGLFRQRTLNVFGTLYPYEYDNDGMLKSAHTLSVTYKPSTVPSEQTALVASTTVSGVTESYAYNQFGELQSLHARFGTETRLKIDYEPLSGSARVARDNLGRVVEREDTLGSEVKRFKYTYDGAGRLTDVYEYASGVAKLREHYVYGVNGTRTSVSKYTGGVLTSTKSAFYNDQDQLETFDGAKYTYLPSGELSTKEVGGTIVEQYEWDAHGNLLAVVFPTATDTALKRIDYIVDPLGHRVGKKETRGTLAAVLTRRWLWDGSLRIVGEDELARWDGTTSSYATKQIKTAYLYAGRPNVPALAVRKDLAAGTTETYRILTDQLGSVRLVVNAATGQTVQRMDYDAYGVVELDTIASGWTPVPFGFAGGLYDRDSKLVRFGARDYDAVTGRWISKDPIRFAGGDTNLYGYVGNDPVNRLDPTGHIWRQAWRFGKKILRYGSEITRGEALRLRMMGEDVVTNSSKAAKKLEKDVSTALGGNGKALCEGPHGPNQLPHAHAQDTSWSNRFPGHTFVDASLRGLLPFLLDITDANNNGEFDEQDAFDLFSPVPIDWGTINDILHPDQGA